MNATINAIIAEEDAQGKFTAGLKRLERAALPDEDVLVRVEYSTVNYKDGLAVTGKGRICRKLPMVCGIDLAGTVVESRSPAWAPGDRVLANGYGLSEAHWGGYAQQQRVRPEFLVPVPAALTTEQAMAIGTAGYTAMLSVHAIQDHGVRPEDGAVVVTGAAGGVGTIAILLLARLGYRVTAASGRPETRAFLTSLGATETIERAALARAPKPIEQETWAAAIDSVGSTTLATVLAQTQREGLVAACGLAGGVDLPSSVMPFILRGVTLRGIDSVMAVHERRERAWQALGELVDPDRLRSIYTVEPLANVPALANRILAGQIRGRVVIDVNA